MEGKYGFQALLLSYFSNEKSGAQELRKRLNTKDLRISEIGLTYRTANHWEENGLITNHRRKKSGWRLFSRMDLIWCMIIKELRQFGVPLETIKVAKKHLFKPMEKDRFTEKELEKPGSELEYYSILTMQRFFIYIIVFNTGEATIVFEDDIGEAQKEFGKDNFISINLNNITSKWLFPFPTVYYSGKGLFEEELEIIEQIRNGEFSKITIKLKSGRIKMFTGEEIVKNEIEINKIINKSDFQDITFKKRDGKIVHAKREDIHKVTEQ